MAGRFDGDQLRAWEDSLRERGGAYWDRPPLGLLTETVAVFSEAQDVLEMPMAEALGLRVRRVLARSAGLVGMIFADGGRSEQAYGWLRQAAGFAVQAGDREVACWAHGVTAHVAFSADEHRRLLWEAATAKRLAPSTASVGVAYAEAATAMVYAARGGREHALASLDRCAEAYVGLERSQTTLSVFGYPEPLYQYHRGYVLTRTHQPALARTALARVLNTCPVTAFMPRIAARLELIRCHLDEGHPAAACWQVAGVLAEYTGGSGLGSARSRLVNRLFSPFLVQGPEGVVDHG